MIRRYICLLAIFAASISSAQVMRYDRPASFFEEAIVIGNGTIGAAVYGGVERDRLSLNDITLWSGEPDSTIFSPQASEAIPAVRALLEKEDYVAADREARRIEGHFSQSYQPLGNLWLEFPGQISVTDYSRSLDLETARAVTSYSAGGYSYRREYFASAPDSMIVLRVTTDCPTGVNFNIYYDTPHPNEKSVSDGVMSVDGYGPYFAYPVYYNGSEQKNFYDPQRGTRFATRVRIDVRGGGEVIADDSSGCLRASGVRDAVVYVTNVTSFNGFDRNPASDGRPCRELADSRISASVAKGYEQIGEDQMADHMSLYNRVSLWLGDTDAAIKTMTTDRQLLDYTVNNRANPELEALYFQFGRYLLISCSRTPFVPANLQGLWNEHLTPPWSSNYTTNINLEENYWGTETTNLSELHMPLLQFLRNLSETGRVTARNYFGVDRGWCMAHNSDIWALTNPVGLRESCPSWAVWSMGGAWLSTHIWEHYLFSRDRDFLEDYYPVLRDAAAFCLGWMIERDGELITSPGTSPENFFITADGSAASVSYGNTSDLAIIRECLMAAEAAAATLGTDTAMRGEIADALRRMRKYRVGSDGRLMEWYHDFEDQDPQHRHQSHLVGLYPGHHITPGVTPDLAAACARTLEIKGSNTTGWSAGWRANLLARLADAEGAYAMYRTLLSYVSPDGYIGDDRRGGGGTYPNMLDAHSPFQIDGNFGGSAAVAEMLVQSTPDSVTVLPALPAAWRSGRVSGLRTRCGATVDIEWNDGRAQRVTLSSPTLTRLILLCNGESSEITLEPGRPYSVLR